MSWEIVPGELVQRADVHAVYGGRRQSGISPSNVTPNILLFVGRPGRGSQAPWDGWGDDGCFHYSGEGQRGDQTLTQGNLAVLNHRRDGRALRLFQHVAQTTFEYLGEYRLSETQPWYRIDGVDAHGEARTVIVFRLEPVAPVAEGEPRGPRLARTPAEEYSVQVVNDIIADERSPVSASGHAYGEAERREANLIREYADHLQRHGHRVARQLIQIPGEPRPHRTDLYDASTNRLIEAKGTLHREAVRLAIGQLFDYRRFLSPEPALGLLLPAKPSADILELCRALGVKIIWQEGGGFPESSDG